ncbi:hypothetical protein, partial [Bacillus altitudinis]|uniref:hypothetical protein n=1 Tax=Bacillus altitudinis TaxID=293387 RepID=UPI003B5285FA
DFSLGIARWVAKRDVKASVGWWEKLRCWVGVKYLSGREEVNLWGDGRVGLSWVLGREVGMGKEK